MKKNKKNINPIWGSNFNKQSNPLLEKINSSIDFDKRLALQDLKVSEVHSFMLKRKKIISPSEYKLIIKGLKKIKNLIINKKFKFNKKYEDIHMNIEVELKRLIGDAAEKLHTARSRNDQVATDFKLWIIEASKKLCNEINNLQKTIVKKANLNIKTIFPGFTHLQSAQIVSFAHHLMAYYEMFKRDKERLSNSVTRMNECPLGSAALAGTTFEIDRNLTSKMLGFNKPSSNSMDSVSDRDYALEFLSNIAICGTHLSRFGEDITLWASDQFKFITLSDDFSTGSSIMPQKKNPDSAELIRGKMGRLSGNFISLLTTIKGLPLTYSKDLQEDKEPVFDSFDNLLLSIEVTNGIVNGFKINKNEMLNACKKGNLMATDLADWIVINYNIPFRESYKITAKIINIANKKNYQINDLSENDLNVMGNDSGRKIKKFLKIENSINYKKSIGSTSPKEIRKAIQVAKKELY
ncbi:MAG: argininosuccinate lyase [Pelagibacteraceae bacterium]|nr:argininosuccinate lyase [Pelagibacteraceae bacterium]